MSEKVKILLAKVGLDSHDRGMKVVSSLLREAGMEIVYLGPHQTAENVVNSAIEEDVDVIGLSSHCMEHLGYASKIIDMLKERKADSIPIVVGGVIPKKDIPLLREMGVKDVFAGSMTKDFAQSIKNSARQREERSEQ